MYFYLVLHHIQQYFPYGIFGKYMVFNILLPRPRGEIGRRGVPVLVGPFSPFSWRSPEAWLTPSVGWTRGRSEVRGGRGSARAVWPLLIARSWFVRVIPEKLVSAREQTNNHDDMIQTNIFEGLGQQEEASACVEIFLKPPQLYSST